MSPRANPVAPAYARRNTGNGSDRLQNLPPFPLLLDVELTNVCNFRGLMRHMGTLVQ